MGRRSEILSIAVSAAVVALLVLRFVSVERAAPVETPEAPPEPPAPVETEPPPTPPLTVTLPPPPAPRRSEPDPGPRPAAGETVDISPLRTEPDQAAAAAEIRPLQAEVPVVEPPDSPAIEPVREIELRPLRPEPPEPKRVAVVPDPLPVPAPTPTPERPASAEAAPTVGQEDAKPVMATGGPLLRLFEHGDGPGIDIAWPASTAARDALFATFERCYGMRVALMAADGSLYSDRAETAPWEIDLDRYSGFVRQSGTLLAPAERRWARRISARYPGAAGAAAVRVFPRGIDALLLGGLHRLLGSAYRGTKAIRAKYVRHGDAVFIEGIVADGAPVAGRVALGAAADRRCDADRRIGT